MGAGQSDDSNEKEGLLRRLYGRIVDIAKTLITLNSAVNDLKARHEETDDRVETLTQIVHTHVGKLDMLDKYVETLVELKVRERLEEERRKN